MPAIISTTRQTLKVYRKVGSKRIRLNKAQKARLMRELELRCRVQRPDIVAFFLEGEFYNLPALAPAIIKNRPTRILDHEADGWVIPESNYLKENQIFEDIDAQSMANSIVLWINKNLSVCVNPADFAIVVE